jgi:hypothetical protein
MPVGGIVRSSTTETIEMKKSVRKFLHSITAVALLSFTFAIAPVSLIGLQTMQANACEISSVNGPIGPNGEAFANVATICVDPGPQLYTAVAISPSTFNWGSSWHYGSEQQAEQAAFANCAKNANDCQVVAWTGSGCAALALSEDNQIWGAAYNNFPDFAQGGALKSCRDEGGRNCKVVAHPCSDD